MNRRTYHVTAETAGFSKRRSILRFVSMAGAFAAIHFLLGLVWPTSTSITGKLTESLFSGLFFALIVFFVVQRPSMNYDLIVSDESISAVNSWFERSVHRDEIRTMKEITASAITPPGLRISKLGKIGTFLWGCVWIPKSLPEYEAIKSLAQNWKSR
jgi:hypothetical protein